MYIKDLQDLITQANDLLVNDFKTIHHRQPEEQELLNHLKLIIKEGYLEDIITELTGEEVRPSDFYKLLFIVASDQ